MYPRFPESGTWPGAAGAEWGRLAGTPLLPVRSGPVRSAGQWGPWLAHPANGNGTSLAIEVTGSQAEGNTRRFVTRLPAGRGQGSGGRPTGLPAAARSRLAQSGRHIRRDGPQLLVPDPRHLRDRVLVTWRSGQGKLPRTVLTRRIVVFDKDGLNSPIPPPADPPPTAADIAYVIEETLRQAANFPTVIVRQDWLLGVIAVQQVQLFLHELFAESNKLAPPTGPNSGATSSRPPAAAS